MYVGDTLKIEWNTREKSINYLCAPNNILITLKILKFKLVYTIFIYLFVNFDKISVMMETKCLITFILNILQKTSFTDKCYLF